MGKHINTNLVQAFVAFATTSVQVSEMRRALEVDVKGMSDADVTRLDGKVVAALAVHYGVEAVPMQKQSKFSGMHFDQRTAKAASMALYRVRGIFLGKTKATDERSPIEKHIQALIAAVNNSEKDAKKAKEAARAIERAFLVARNAGLIKNKG